MSFATHQDAEDAIHALETGTMRVVDHGTDANFPRPAVAAVYWVGSVEPLNAVDDDLWVG